MPLLLIGFMLLQALVPFHFMADSSYHDQVLAWQKSREARLQSDTGWLTVAGLFWLKPGDNTAGTDETNSIVLPKNSAPAQIGRFRLDGSRVTFTNLADDALTVDGKPAASEITLKDDTAEKPDVIQINQLSMFVIKRGDRYGIRLRDKDSEFRKKFTGLRYFPIREDLRIEAKFVADPKKISVPNILGRTDLQDSPGVAVFTLNGKEYKLRPVFEDDTLFFIFKDLTSKTETYQAGRFLNTPLPKDGKVLLDFNRTYNPPCAFTPYATCPLPPKENILPARIEAGELRYGKIP